MKEIRLIAFCLMMTVLLSIFLFSCQPSTDEPGEGEGNGDITGDINEGNNNEEHEHEYHQLVIDSTCSAEGSMKYACKICGEVKSEEIIPMKEHSYVEIQVHEPTHIYKGYTEVQCSECYHKSEENFVDPIPTCNLEYVVNKDGVTCAVIGKGDCTHEDLIVPEQIDGYTVTEIKENAFENAAHYNEIIVSDTIERIGKAAFKGCNQLRRITIPFVGENMNSSGENGVLGYIFGYETRSTSNLSGYKTSEGDGYTVQLSDSYYGRAYCYYIPKSLWSVSITLDKTIPDRAFFDCDLIVVVEASPEITEIGQQAFSSCTSLQAFIDPFNVLIPESVTKLGYRAFFCCTSIQAMVIKSSCDISPYAFYDCSNARSVDFYGDTCVIGDAAFQGVPMAQILLPDTVTTIGDYAFQNSYAYIRNLPEALTTIGKYAFSKATNTELSIPDSVTKIGEAAFFGCANVTKVTIPFIGGSLDYFFGEDVAVKIEELTVTSSDTISSYAFRDCVGLKRVTYYKKLTSIGREAFSGCVSLTVIDADINDLKLLDYHVFHGCSSLIQIGDFEPKTVILSESVAEIRSYAFMGCTQIEKVIVKGTKQIGDYAFRECTSLCNVTLPEGLTSIGERAFEKSLITYIKIPDTVTKIGNYAFVDCALERVDLSASLLTIGEYAFANCPGKELVLPYGLERISKGAFQNWQMTDLIIPDSVTSVYEFAFSGCDNLVNLTMPFVGSGVGATDWWGVLGYIFGYTTRRDIYKYSSYTTSNNDIGTYQFSSMSEYLFDIPKSLRHVTITKDDTVSPRDFLNCDLLESITIMQPISGVVGGSFKGCKNLTNIYYGGSESDWNAAFSPESLASVAPNVFVHFNIDTYGLYINTGSVTVSELGNRKYMLLPLGKDNAVSAMAYNVLTHELVPLAQGGVTISGGGKSGLKYANSKLSVIYGGADLMKVTYQDKNGQEIANQEINIFSVDPSQNSLYGPQPYSIDERDYIAFCINLHVVMESINESEEQLDIQVNLGEKVFNYAANLKDYLADLSAGEGYEEAVLKKALMKFISSYVDENYLTERAIDEAYITRYTLEAVHEIYKKCHDDPTFDFGTTTEAFMLFEEMYDNMLKDGLRADELEQMMLYATEIISTEGIQDLLYKTVAWNSTLKKLTKNVTELKEIFYDITKAFDWLGWKGEVITVWEDTMESDPLKPGMIVLESVLFMTADYKNNIEVLQMLKDELIKGGYSSTDKEIKVINDLIKDYQESVLVGIGKLVTEVVLYTIEEIATKNPLVSIAKIAIKLISDETTIDERLEWLALDRYRQGLKSCYEQANELYLTGRMSSNIAHTKFIARLYLNMVYKCDKLAYDIATSMYDSADYTQYADMLFSNMLKIDSIIKNYCK